MREALAADDDALENFVHEVRRFYPFTPLLAATARHDFDWQALRFRSGDLAVLDVYGTLRDPRVWSRPDEFDPARFAGRSITPFNFIPNGGGALWTGHRCAGEWLTIEALKQATCMLTRRVSYELPAQDLEYSLRRVPTRPRSGVVLGSVRTHAYERPATEVLRPRGTHVGPSHVAT